MRLAVLLTFILTSANALCFCPSVCLPTSGSSCGYIDRTLCVDYEAAQECISANAEITDAVNSMGRNADLFLTAAIYNNSLTPAAASFLRTQMSIALEDNKPVGDCEAGAATQSLAKGTNSHCFSWPLYTQCVMLRENVGAWAAGIRGKLNASVSRADVPPALGAAFVAAMGDRAEANTARVRCVAYEFATQQLSPASAMSVHLLPLASATSLLLLVLT